MADQLLETAPAQAAPVVAPDPPIKRLWTSLRGSNKEFTRSFEDLTQDMQDVDNVKSLHEHLSKTHDGFTVPLDQFESDMGLKKKEQSGPSSSPAGVGAQADKPFVEAAPPADVAMAAEQAGVDGHPQLVEDSQMAAYLQANPALRAKVISDEAQTMGAAPEGTKRTVYAGPVDAQGVPVNKDGLAPYRARNSATGVYYTDEPLSKMVDGKEQSEDDAGMLTIRNGLAKGLQGPLNYLGAADRRLHDSAVGRALDGLDEKLGADPYNAADPNVFQAGADFLGDKAISKVAPYHEQSQSAHMRAARVAGLALPTVLSFALPEGKIAGAVAKIMSLNFEGQMAQGAFDAVDTAGLKKGTPEYDNIALAQATTTQLLFTFGALGMNAAGQKLLQTELMAGIRQSIGNTAARLSEGEMGAVVAKIAPRAIEAAKGAVKGGASMGILMGANTAKDKVGEHLANQAIGRAAFPEKTFGEDLKDIGASTADGIAIGGSTGMAEGAFGKAPAPRPTNEAPSEAPAGPQPIPPDAAAQYGKEPWRNNVDTGIVHEGKPVLADVTPDGKYFELHDGSNDGSVYDNAELNAQVAAVLPAKLAEQQRAEVPPSGIEQPAEAPIIPEQVQPEQAAADPAVVDVTGQAPEPIPAGGEPAQQPNERLPSVSEAEYANFVDNNAVSPERLQAIADKVKAGEQLTDPKEQAIFNGKTAEIEQLIKGVEQPAANEQPPVTATPEGQKERQHPLHYDEATQAALKPEDRYYTPRSRIQNADEANGFIDEHGLDNAYKFVMNGERDNPDGSPVHAAVLDEVRGQVKQRLLDASIAAKKAGNEPESARLLQQSLDVLGKRAQARAETAQTLAQYQSDITDNPDRALDDYAASVQQSKEKVDKQYKKKVAAADKEATDKRKAKVEEVLADDTVKEAAERVTEWATTGSKPAKKGKAAPKAEPVAPADTPTWGSKNKLFTKEKIADARAALKKLGLSSFVPPELLHMAGYHMEAGARSFAEMSKRVIRDVGAKVKPLLKDAYEAAKKELIAKGDPGHGFDGPDAVDAAMQKELAEALANRIVSEARPKVPGKYDPVQELLDTLTKKVRETLPNTKQKPRDAREAIAHALQNKAEYKDVFEQSKALVEAKIDAMKVSDAVKAKMREELRAFHADTIGDPFSVRQLDTAMRSGMKELGQKIEKLVREHADVRNAAAQSLTDNLVSEAGLSPAQAKEYADAIHARYKALSEKKAQSLTGRILAPVKAKLPGSKTRTVVDKLTEALDIADAGGEGASPAAALLQKMAGIPDVTVEDVEAFRKLADKVREASKPKTVTIKGDQVEVIDTKAQQKAVADLLRYGATKMGKVTWWAKTRAMQYAFRLSGLDTQGRNLKANVLHTGFEQGLITPAYNMLKNRSIYGGTAGFKGYVKGQRQGLSEAAYTLRTGYTGETVQDKFGDNSPLETMQGFAGKAKYVGRAMIAGDQVTSIPTENSRTYEVAVQEGFKMARGYTDPATGKSIKLSGRALRDAAWAEANEILYNTKEAVADIHHVLEQEGIPPITLAQIKDKEYTMGQAVERGIARDIRTADLLRQARAAQNPELVSEAQDYARIQTLNGDVPGQLGVVLDKLSGLGKDNPVMDAIMTNVMPFMKIPANSLLRKLEWGGGPVTLLKAALGRTSLTMRVKEGRKYSRELSSDERGKLALRGALSTAVWAGMYGLIHNGTISITGPATGKSDEDLLQPQMTVKIGSHTFNYKDTDVEYPLVIAAALQKYIRKQEKGGLHPDIAQVVAVAAMHSAAYMVTTGPMNGPADMGNVLIQANQGNYASAGGYFKRFAITAIKTGTIPAIAVQSGNAYRDWQGMAQREKKSNSLGSELLVNFTGWLPYAEVGEDKINFAGDPIVIDRDGQAVWKDEQTKRIAETLVHLNLLPPRQAPTDDQLALFDPKTGDRVTPLSDAEFRQYVVMRGQEFIKRLTARRENGSSRLTQIEQAKTASVARHKRDLALDGATEAALQAIEKQRAIHGQPAEFELSRQLKKAKDAANFTELKAELVKIRAQSE